MPMQPRPMADTSRLLFPSFRFCMITSLLVTINGQLVRDGWQPGHSSTRGEFRPNVLGPDFCLKPTAKKATARSSEHLRVVLDYLRNRIAVHEQILSVQNKRSLDLARSHSKRRNSRAAYPSSGKVKPPVAQLSMRK